MKKKSIITITVCIVLIFALSICAVASNGNKTAKLYYRDIKINVNGETITPKDATGKTVEPFIIDGTTYLPVRAVAEALDCDVSWDSSTSTVIITDKTGNSDISDSKYGTVYVSKNGKMHSVPDCSGMKYYTAMSYEKAIAAGYERCSNCF